MSGESASTTTSMPSWAQPYTQAHMDLSQRAAAQPYQAYGGDRVAQMNPYQTAGYNAQAARATNGSAVNNAASQALTSTLNGQYLSGNPHIEGIVDQAGRDVNRNYDMVAARSGSFGNANVEADRSRALADSAMTLRANDYNTERGYQQQAIGMAPTIANQDYVDANALVNAGQAFQQQEQRNLDADYSNWTEARDHPIRQLEISGMGLGQNTGSTTTSNAGSNPWNTALGAAALYGGTFGGGGDGK